MSGRVTRDFSAHPVCVDRRDVTWILIRLRVARRREGGFTLVEVMVAIGMATVVLTAFAYASTSSVQAIHTARLNQQGADLATAQLERMRTRSFGSLGHDPAGIAPDPHLSGGSFAGETLVQVKGGLSPQISTATQNGFLYTVYTYVTRPVDVTGADNRRVTVVAEWAAYGRTWSKTMSTVVTQSARGLPLPEFKLTAVGPSTITVNPGATAAFGFQLSNQGAPDQFNLTTNLAGAVLYLDNGNDVFEPTLDTTLMTDHNSDGVIDTGRLEPKQEVVFWAVRTVPSGTPNGTTNWTITATASSQETESGIATLNSVLVVTAAVITASPTPSPSTSVSTSPSPTDTSPTPSASTTPTICAASQPAPTPSTVSGYSVKAYTLHNSGTLTWPTTPLPEGTIPGSTAKLPMYMDMAAVSIPASRELPVFSTDLSPSDSPGRLLYPGGSFSSSSASTVLSFITQNPSRSYTGSVVLRMWVQPQIHSHPVGLSAQLLTFKTNNSSTTAVGSAVALNIPSFGCDGWQEVWWQFSGVSIAGASKTVLGVRIWNTNTDSAHKVRLAYDHGLFPASLTVVEK
jgi:type II secretory pathway pseudopilin PulG